MGGVLEATWMEVGWGRLGGGTILWAVPSRNILSHHNHLVQELLWSELVWRQWGLGHL